MQNFPFSLVIKSLGPPHSVEITGSPHANASRAATPKVSVCDETIKTSDACRLEITSLFCSLPKSLILFVNHSPLSASVSFLFFTTTDNIQVP